MDETDAEKIPAVQLNRKMNLMAEGSAYPVPRVTHRKAYRKQSACFKIKCGCCDQVFDIYYGNLDYPELPSFASLEIAGVNAGIHDWRAVLLPLLGFERQGEGWVDMQEEK